MIRQQSNSHNERKSFRNERNERVQWLIADYTDLDAIQNLSEPIIHWCLAASFVASFAASFLLSFDDSDWRSDEPDKAIGWLWNRWYGWEYMFIKRIEQSGLITGVVTLAVCVISRCWIFAPNAVRNWRFFTYSATSSLILSRCWRAYRGLCESLISKCRLKMEIFEHDHSMSTNGRWQTAEMPPIDPQNTTGKHRISSNITRYHRT